MGKEGGKFGEQSWFTSNKSEDGVDSQTDPN